MGRPKIYMAVEKTDTDASPAGPAGFVGYLCGENCACSSHDAVSRGLQLVAKKDAEMWKEMIRLSKSENWAKRSASECKRMQIPLEVVGLDHKALAWEFACRRSSSKPKISIL